MAASSDANGESPLQLVLVAPVLIGGDHALFGERRDVEAALDVVEPHHAVAEHCYDPEAATKVAPGMQLPLGWLAHYPNEQGACVMTASVESTLDPALKLVPVDRLPFHCLSTSSTLRLERLLRR